MLWFLLEFAVNHLLLSTICCFVASTIVLTCFNRLRCSMKIERAQKMREQALHAMERRIADFKKQHGDVDSSRILSLSLVDLVEQLKNGSLSPETVLHVYMEKSLEVTKEVNCVTDFLSECETQVQELKKQQEKGLLYGVPISLKDNAGYKGHTSHCGLVHYLGAEEAEDCVVVQVLKRQGAVPFVKTNIPQSMINFDCSNSIFGQTLNPHNHKKTCGGSSGGEGALIAAGGAILGVGTDVLGSIRMPSSFCGICGLKPSGERLSDLGFLTPVSGMKSAVSMPGPMARDVDSLALFMKAVLCDDLFQLDPSVPPVPFNDEIFTSRRRLTIGFYDTDGYFLPHPSVRRAIQETKTLLEEAGHKLVPFTPPRIEFALNELCIRGFFADGGKTLVEKFRPDIVDPNLKQQMILWKIPNIVKKIVSYFLRPVFPRIANHVEAHSGCSIHGVRPCLDGMTAVPMCVGPMARDVDSLVLTMKAIWCDEHFQLDPNVPPLYFNEKTFSSVAPLRIGYYEEDGFFQPNPSMRRILLETKKLLEAAGHQLVPFSPPRVDFVYNLFVKTLFGDGGKPLEHKFDNNIVDPNLRENHRLCKMSGVVKQLIAFCLRPIFPRISKVVHSSVGARSLMDSWADQTALQDYQAEFISEWRKLGLDVVLCPMLGPAFNKGYAARLLATISYTMLYNVLQFPAGVVPVGSVTRDDEEELKNYRGYDNDPWDRLYREAVSGGVGLPLSVQCVALPYQDELCLRLMKEVETLRR